MSNSYVRLCDDGMLFNTPYNTITIFGCSCCCHCYCCVLVHVGGTVFKLQPRHHGITFSPALSSNISANKRLASPSLAPSHACGKTHRHQGSSAWHKPGHILHQQRKAALAMVGPAVLGLTLVLACAEAKATTKLTA